MSIEEIASYCGIMDCTVYFGNPETGFIRVDGNGILDKHNNYRRFLAHHELSLLPSPSTVLRTAEIFRIESVKGVEELKRDEFQNKLDFFQEMIAG